MNINNVNNPINRVESSQNEKVRSHTVGTEEAGIARQEVAPTELVNSVPASSGVDNYEATVDRKAINELVSEVENMQEAPREELIAFARARVSQGYYNNPENISGIANKMINTETN